MSQHPNAKLAPRGRETLVSRIESGVPVAEAARQMGVSRQTAGKWLRRSRSGEGLSDRGSRPRRLAAATGVPARTCARIVARRGMPGLADVDRVTGEVRRRGPVTRVRYERERPGELVHVDVKKVARILDGGGHRALGRGCGSARGAGAACLHVAVDDFSRVAHAELLPDERKGRVMWLYLIGQSDESLRALRGKEAPCGTPSTPGSSPRTSGGRWSPW